MDVITLALAKKYTDKSIEGAGAVQGKSAYEIAIENGFSGTVEDWLESLQGQPARLNETSHHWEVFDPATGSYVDTGLSGEGIQGEKGEQGLAGKDGTKIVFVTRESTTLPNDVKANDVVVNASTSNLEVNGLMMYIGDMAKLVSDGPSSKLLKTGNIRGAAGTTGKDGKRGNWWWSATENTSSAPDGAIDGDLLVNVTEHELEFNGMTIEPGEFVRILYVNGFAITGVLGSIRGAQGADALEIKGYNLTNINTALDTGIYTVSADATGAPISGVGELIVYPDIFSQEEGISRSSFVPEIFIGSALPGTTGTYIRYVNTIRREFSEWVPFARQLSLNDFLSIDNTTTTSLNFIDDKDNPDAAIRLTSRELSAQESSTNKTLRLSMEGLEFGNGLENPQTVYGEERLTLGDKLDMLWSGGNLTINGSDDFKAELSNFLDAYDRNAISNAIPKVNSPEWVVGDVDSTSGAEIESTTSIRLPKNYAWERNIRYTCFNGEKWYLKSRTKFTEDGTFYAQYPSNSNDIYVIIYCDDKYPLQQVVFAKKDGTEVTQQDIYDLDVFVQRSDFDLLADDNRDFKPSTIKGGHTKGQVCFISLEGIVDTATYGKYADALILDTWNDTSGGKVNVLVTCKQSNSVLFLQGEQDGDTWSSIRELNFSGVGAGSVTIDTTQVVTGQKTFTSSTFLSRAMLNRDKVTNTSYGTPSIWEAAKIPEVEPDQLAFFPTDKISFKTSTEVEGEENWTDATFSTTVVSRLFGGDVNSAILLNLSPLGSSDLQTQRVAVDLEADNYCWLNDLVISGSTTRSNWKLKILGQTLESSEWQEITNDDTRSKSAEFFLHVSHPTIQLHPTATGANRFARLRILFYDFNISDPSVANNLVLWKLKWFGVYPSTVRQPFATDSYKNLTTTGSITVGKNPTANMNVATKKYVDDAISSSGSNPNTMFIEWDGKSSTDNPANIATMQKAVDLFQAGGYPVLISRIIDANNKPCIVILVPYKDDNSMRFEGTAPGIISNGGEYVVYTDAYVGVGLSSDNLVQTITPIGTSNPTVPKVMNGGPLYKFVDIERTTPAALDVKNTRSYIPTSDYNPATKKYVDDSINQSQNLSNMRRKRLINPTFSAETAVEEKVLPTGSAYLSSSINTSVAASDTQVIYSSSTLRHQGNYNQLYTDAAMKNLNVDNLTIAIGTSGNTATLESSEIKTEGGFKAVFLYSIGQPNLNQVRLTIETVSFGPSQYYNSKVEVETSFTFENLTQDAWNVSISQIENITVLEHTEENKFTKINIDFGSEGGSFNDLDEFDIAAHLDMKDIGAEGEVETAYGDIKLKRYSPLASIQLNMLSAYGSLESTVLLTFFTEWTDSKAILRFDYSESSGEEEVFPTLKLIADNIVVDKTIMTEVLP